MDGTWCGETAAKKEGGAEEGGLISFRSSFLRCSRISCAFSPLPFGFGFGVFTAVWQEMI